jgi:hypothetical protein
MSYKGSFKGSGALTVSETPPTVTLSTESISALEESTVVYPNPTFNSLTIKLADDTIKSLAIYNILGQTMKVMSMETANKQANLNVANLARDNIF